MNRSHRIPALAALAAALLLMPPAAAQQPMPQPKASPRASVTQVIGLTEVTVNYHRPAVRGRKVLGDLVPYGEVWRAGANENTSVSFSSAVQVEDKDLPAGTYGLHMLPTQDTWTVIFSRNATSWGSYSYDEAEDALRVAVKPVQAPHTEWLAFEFGELSDTAATLALRWETLSVPMQLTVDTRTVVLDTVRNAYLRDLPGFYWQGPHNAAAWCLRNQVNLEEALTWSDRSLAIAANYTNLSTKAGLLEALGRGAEAQPLRAKALGLATEQELNTAGYQLLQANQLERALELFKANVAAHPDSWNAHDSLAEASARGGDIQAAIGHYRRALALAEDPAEKARITATLEQLGAP